VTDLSRDKTGPDLRAESLRLAYDDRIVVEDLDLAIPPGRITAVVGANACGKSTLLRALARLLAPKAGAVLLDGRSVHSIPTRALRIRAGGRCLGLSADTAFDPALIDWLAEADLIVHETGHGPHTPYEKLAELPARLRAKMRLIHYPDDFDAAASLIEPLVPGRSYAV